MKVALKRDQPVVLRDSRTYERSNLTCPPEGCSRGFLAGIGVVYALGTSVLLKAVDKGD